MRPKPPNNAGNLDGPSLARAPAAPSAGMSTVRPAPDLRLRVAYLSDRGRVRDHQEDAVGVFAPGDPAVLARKGQLLIVADGMGGHQAGEVASQLAVAEISAVYYANPDDDLAASLAHALQAANQAIYRQAQAAQDEQGMGTTVAAAVIRGRQVQLASIGDSRIYLLRGRAISQVTEDHSWVAEQMRAGILSPQQAASHPQRNLVLRALGKGDVAQPDFFSGELGAGDVLLLCSDGLTRHVSDVELADIAGSSPPDLAVRRLVDLANSRGGSDNISVIVARLESPEAIALAAAPHPVPAAMGVSPRWVAAVIAAVALLAVSVLLLALLLRREAGGKGQERAPAAPTMAAVRALTPAPAGITAPPPTATLAPTAPQDRVGAAVVLPAPTDLEIANSSGASLLNPEKVRFTWRWDGELPAGYAFEVRIWKKDGDPHLGAAAPEQTRQGNIWTQTIDVRHAPAVLRGGDGTYRWTVAVVHSGQAASPEATPREFEYSGQSPATVSPVRTVLPPIERPTLPIRQP